MLKKRDIEIDEELAIWRIQLPIYVYIYILNTHTYIKTSAKNQFRKITMRKSTL